MALFFVPVLVVAVVAYYMGQLQERIAWNKLIEKWIEAGKIPRPATRNGKWCP